jgi:outer membrane assembly lipoprotein YfiO
LAEDTSDSHWFERLRALPYHFRMISPLRMMVLSLMPDGDDASAARRVAAVIVVAMLVGVLSASGFAQSRYVLGEDDAWTSEEEVDPTTPEGQLLEARRALAEGDTTRAENLTTRWIERHDRHPLVPDAYLIRGDAKYARGDEYKALFDYEYVARMFPGSEAFVTALEREYEIARDYAHGRKRKLWGMRIIKADSEAEELLIRIQERVPGSQLAEQAGMELADMYFRQRNMPLAAEAYDLFIENYPRSEQISKARRRSIYAHLASFKGPQFDISGMLEAQYRLQELQILEPMTAEQIGADALLVRIDESAAMKKLENARWYRRTGDIIAAELSLRRLIDRFPDTIAAAEGLDMAIRLLPRLPQRVRDQAPDYETIREARRGFTQSDEHGG